jgi:hypothetical protein
MWFDDLFRKDRPSDLHALSRRIIVINMQYVRKLGTFTLAEVNDEDEKVRQL